MTARLPSGAFNRSSESQARRLHTRLPERLPAMSALRIPRCSLTTARHNNWPFLGRSKACAAVGIQVGLTRALGNGFAGVVVSEKETRGRNALRGPPLQQPSNYASTEGTLDWATSLNVIFLVSSKRLLIVRRLYDAGVSCRLFTSSSLPHS
jgi:hypothetical protein